MSKVHQRHRTSPPGSPQEGRFDFSLGDLLPQTSGRRSPRNPYKGFPVLKTRVKSVLIVLAIWVCLACLYNFQLKREDSPERTLKHRPAHWLKERYVDRFKDVADKLTKHVQIHLRGMDQKDQNKFMQILNHAIHAADKEDEQDSSTDVESESEDEPEPADERQTTKTGLDPEEMERIKKQERIDAAHAQDLRPLSERTEADRHILNFLDIVENCQNPVVDMNDPSYSTQKAVRIFEKCRLLIFKNAFDTELMEEYRQQYAEYITGLKEGKISREGGNTGGDSLFLAGRGRGRYEIILPERMAHPDIVNNERILEVVKHWRVLGGNAALRSLQSLVAEGNQGGGTPGQPWHFDQGFLFGQEHGGLQHFGIAGHDIPPAAISLAMPLLDMERETGPTEFCVGSSALNGVNPHPDVFDQSLIEEGSLFQKYNEHPGFCPPECWISPLLKLGDAVLWDYGVRHRGGWNASPNLRSIILLIYAKRWFDDINFGNKPRHHQPEDEDPEVTDLLTRTRFALPDYDKPLNHEVTTPLEKISYIYPNEPYKFEGDHKTVDFIATNWDVEGNPTLYVDGVPQGTLKAKTSRKVQGAFGDLMQLRIGTQVVGQFKCNDHGQFVFTKDATW